MAMSQMGWYFTSLSKLRLKKRYSVRRRTLVSFSNFKDIAGSLGPFMQIDVSMQKQLFLEFTIGQTENHAIHAHPYSNPFQENKHVEKSFHDGAICLSISRYTSIFHKLFHCGWNAFNFIGPNIRIQCVVFVVMVVVVGAWKTKNISSLPISMSSPFDWKKGRHLLKKSRF